VTQGKIPFECFYKEINEICVYPKYPKYGDTESPDWYSIHLQKILSLTSVEGSQYGATNVAAESLIA
jgi:hypothetical protein